ncbi:MAG TPA: hypothetical protein VGI40_25125 [Pirellulaceae bacterium]|jgi:hypothetical protein
MNCPVNRLPLIVFGLIALAGLALGWHKGRLPQREPVAVGTVIGSDIAPDLALYREVIREVRHGRDYYDVARETIPAYGFPIASPLNWRLPTYAWVLSRLPNKCWIQLVLLLLALGGMWLTFVASSRRNSVGLAALTTFLMFGVLRWTFDGYAYLAQEVWASVLIVISLALLRWDNVGWDKDAQHPPAHRSQPSISRWLAIAAGIAALLFRELALPYCGISFLMSAWKRRWWEAAAWAAGITLFFAFFAWHVAQVKAQLAGTEIAAAGGAGLSQWLRFGGLDFILLTTRMNSLLFAAPSWLLWLYVLLALMGLGRSRNESSQLACLTALAYLVAFAIIGRPENFYWGLMPAPFLAWGGGELAGLLREFSSSCAQPAASSLKAKIAASI